MKKDKEMEYGRHKYLAGDFVKSSHEKALRAKKTPMGDYKKVWGGEIHRKFTQPKPVIHG